jgi:VanZ family protein
MSAAQEEAVLPAPEPAKLRYSKLWWGIGWTFIALVVYGSLQAPDRADIPFLVSDKLVHFGAYWLMTLWFAGVLHRRRYPWLALGLLALGGGIELLQGAMGFGRDADWRDMVANTLGIFTALGVAYAGLGSWMVVIERRLAPSAS